MKYCRTPSHVLLDLYYMKYNISVNGTIGGNPQHCTLLNEFKSLNYQASNYEYQKNDNKRK